MDRSLTCRYRATPSHDATRATRLSGPEAVAFVLQIDLCMVQALCLRQVLVGERTVIDCKYKNKDLQQEGWFLPVGTEIKLFRTQCKVAALGLE